MLQSLQLQDFCFWGMTVAAADLGWVQWVVFLILEDHLLQG